MYKVKRKPVLIGERTVALISLFHKVQDHISDFDFWTHDLSDHCATGAEAAEQLVAFFGNSWTPQFMMELRRAITKKLLEHDKEFGSKWAGELDLIGQLTRQMEWSRETFGPGSRTKGVCDHIRKELAEIEAEPDSTEEWIDVMILGFDGAWRSGATVEQIIATYFNKMEKNYARQWPDWRARSEDEAIEHIRDNE